jgi:vacuolar-type H+-ATPase subunit H
MTDEITNTMLLQHMHAMKGELLGRISAIDKKVTHLQKEVADFKEETKRNFEDARLHRQALQEDLEATMRMTAKHQKKLTHLRD